MKKYKVSLAIKVYSNFEVEVRAETKRKALSKALDRYYSGKYDVWDITEPDWANSEFDIDAKGDIDTNLDNGIDIEEIE